MTNYFMVSINGRPNSGYIGKIVGWYQKEETAKQVSKVIQAAINAQNEIGTSTIYSGKGEMVDLANGDWRLKETPRGAMTVITKDITNEELKRILEVVSRMVETDAPVKTDTADDPQKIVDGTYHRVVLKFHPFDGTRKHIVGYYQSEATAQKVMGYIRTAHQAKKVGSGFDMTVESYDGKYVEHRSGKCFLLVGGEHQEVQSRARNLHQVSLGVIEAIGKWS